MTRPARRLRTQLALSMILTAMVALGIFIVGMTAFYIYVQESWIDGLHEDNRRALTALLDSQQIDPDALTTLIGAFAGSWMEGYGRLEWTFVLALVTVSLVCSILIGVAAARRISKPIETVTEAVARVSAGDLDAAVQPDRRAAAEAVALLRSFNGMTGSLRQAERESGASAAAIAHELRTPLTVLRGRLQGLRDGVFKPSAEGFAVLVAQVETLSRIVDDLDTLSRLTAGQLALERRPIDLANEAETVIAALRPDLEAEGFEIEQIFSPARIDGDPARIRQALAALLDNARQHAQSGRFIRVETGQEPQAAWLRVVDRGPGLADADRERVFDRWWRADASRSREKGGSGLGLAVVRTIARAHGGDAVMETGPRGVGSAFALSFPRTHLSDASQR